MSQMNATLVRRCTKWNKTSPNYILILLLRTLLLTISLRNSLAGQVSESSQQAIETEQKQDETQTIQNILSNGTSSRSSRQNAWSDRNVSESRQSILQVGPGEQQFVAGGASSLQPPAVFGSQAQHRGRIVDRIASATETNGRDLQQTSNQKLDYIIEFLRQNKLNKFCDLLTNQANDLIENRVIKRLNSMKQFTLFVPTNEALLLQPGQLFEQLRSQPEEAAKFLLSHATNELVVPKLAGNAASKLVYSLANSPLRVSTLAPSGPMSGPNRLELIVNGANILPGHSYALQEPNNSNATHAIVHLVDRSLYPSPSENLLDLMRQFAPTMAQLIELASSQQASLGGGPDMRNFKQYLESQESLTTFFAPNEEAFRATPAKLLDQLYTNRTFLQQFLRAHQLGHDQLHFNGQLAMLANANIGKQHPNYLNSIGGDKLEFEAKSVQNRQLVVVNSVPIVVPDLMATNGVLHLTSRPLFSPNLLDDCKCNANIQSTSANRNIDEPIEGNLSGSPPIVMGSGRGQQPQIPLAGPSELKPDLLERESSSPLARLETNQQIRAQRSNSGSLPIGAEKNRLGFYRPSLEPANLKLVQALGSGVEPLGFAEKRAPSAVAQLTSLSSQGQPKQLEPLPVVSNYEITLNATSRQRLRAEQLKRPPGQQQGNLFAYDEPLSPSMRSNVKNTTSQPAERLKRPYLAGVVELRPLEAQQHLQQESLNLGADFLSRGESAKREQRLLRFQPEDGRDASQIQQANAAKSSLSANYTANSMQPAYDYVSSSDSGSKLRAVLGQQQAPNSLSCAFYDSECRKLMGRLVRLPPVGSRLATGSKLAPVGPNVTAAYDTTFPTGEKTQTTPIASPTRLQHQQQIASGRYVQPTTRQTSALNQPLPPLSLDESANLRQLASSHQWRIQDGDINRIVTPSVGKSQEPTHTIANPTARLVDLGANKYAHGFTSGLSRQQGSNGQSNSSMVFELPRESPNSPARQAQILFVPVKLVNETNLQRIRHNNSLKGDQSIHMDLPGNVLVLSKSEQQQQHSTNSPSGPAGTSQYLAPIQPMAQFSGAHSQIMHQNHNYNLPYPTRSNLSLAEDPTEGFDVPMGADMHTNGNYPANSTNFANQRAVNSRHQDERPKQAQYAQQIVSNLPPTPALAHRKQQQQLLHQHQVQSQNGFDVPQGAVKWPSATQFQQQQLHQGDFSVTSARLSELQNSSSTGLATQATNQQQLSLANNLQAAQGGATSSADYFQDRTIAEIMDDSGLRIDGQLVTFRRLKQCLSDANLLSLASQTGNSLTIFMPTDQAFQRLVQLAFGQRQSGSLGQSTTTSSFSQQPPAGGQLPLVVRAPPTEQALSSLDSSQVMSASLGALDRLTLDCQAPIVRQMLLDHISARLITPKQLASDTSIASLSGRQLILSSVPSKQIVVVDGQPVLAATRAKNGMVYVINKFLNLTQQMGNVMDLIQSQPELSTFSGYLRANENVFGERLKREAGPVTILAPTNDAFDQLSPAARQLISSDPTALTEILRGHVIDGAQFGKLISMRSKLNTMNKDQRIEARVIKPNVYMLDNQMTSMRLVGTAANGVVNAIDRLIVPSWLRLSMSTRNLPSQPAPTSSGLDTSASANSQAATLAKQRLSSVEAGLRLQAPDLIHGNADNIFRNQNTNRKNNNNNNNFNDNQLNRLNGDNFLQFTPSRQANSSSSSSNLAANSLKDIANPIEPLRSNDLEPTSNGNISVSSKNKNMLLIEKLANLMQTRKFLKFLVNSKAHELLKPDMNYVILVPTDQAIERLPAQILELLERDSERLSDLVNYHILDTTFDYINTIPDGQTLQTLNEKDILFNWHRNNTILSVSGAIVLGGIQEENIALLIVDRVLYPTPGDLLAIVNKSPILSNFTTIIRNAGLESQLTRSGPYTLFAPSDQAFSQLERSDLEFLQRNKEIARRFLLRHLSTPMLFTSSIALSSNMTTRTNNNNLILSQSTPSLNISNSLGEDLILRQRNDYFSVNDINFSYADVAASNGVLHVIDGLL